MSNVKPLHLVVPLFLILTLLACGGVKHEDDRTGTDDKDRVVSAPLVVDMSEVERVVAELVDSVTAIASADLDGDGDIDVVAAASTGLVAWYENDGGLNPTFSAHVLVNAFTDEEALAIQSLTEAGVIAGARVAGALTLSDIDDDGDVDILSTSGRELNLFQNNGALQPSFLTHIIDTLAPGSWVTSIQVQDIDGDGDKDIAASYFGVVEVPVCWYEGVGEAELSFSKHALITDHFGVRSMQVIDFDQDGDMDVVTGGRSTIWLENNGAHKPEFTMRMIVEGASYILALQVLDMDADGDLDILALTNMTTNTGWDASLLWYEDNNINEEFTVNIIKTDLRGILGDFEAKDMDGDGDTDVLLSSVDQVILLENDGTAKTQYVEHIIAEGAENVSAVLAVDLNGDGNMEVVSALHDRDTVVWQSTASHQHYVIEGEGLVLDGRALLTYETPLGADGHLEYTVSSDSIFSVEQISGLLYLDKAPAFSTTGGNLYETLLSVTDGHYVLHHRIQLTVIADDGDDDNDGVLDAMDAFPRNAAEAFDYDGDGLGDNQDPDDDNDGVLDIWDSASLNELAFSLPQWNSSGDAGAPDLAVVAKFSVDSQYVWSAGSKVLSVDLDGDGLLDRFTINSQEAVWFPNVASTNQALADGLVFVQSDSPRKIDQITFLDFNQDGKLDALVRLVAYGSINSTNVVSLNINDAVLYLNIGTTEPAFVSYDIPNLQPLTQFLDMDGDGDIDLFSYNFDRKLLEWYENDGTLVPQFDLRHTLSISAHADNADDLQLEDVDGDGDLDVLSVSKRYGFIVWYENNQQQSLKDNRHVVGVSDDAIGLVAIGDMDLDGDMDFFAASSKTNSIVVYENTGLPSRNYTRRPLIGSEYDFLGLELKERSLKVDDLDGDGDPDIIWVSNFDANSALGAENNSVSLSWFENGGGTHPVFLRHVLQHGVEIALVDGVVYSSLYVDTQRDAANNTYINLTTNYFTPVWYATTKNNYRVQAGETLAFDMGATDADGNKLTYKIAHGPDAHLTHIFSIDESTGVITANDAPSVTSPEDANGDNVYTFWVAVSDGQATLHREVWVTVTPE